MAKTCGCPESPYATPAAILAAAFMIVAALIAFGAPVAKAAPAVPVARAAAAGCGV